MVQVINDPTRGSIFGRIGKEVGKGLAESVPQEVERYRLRQGLENIGRQEGLSPFQQFTQLAATPGITPQMIQSGSELLKQQGQAGALRDRTGRSSAGQSFIDRANRQTVPGTQGKQPAPSATTKAPIRATLEPYIPKSMDQLKDRAGELLRDEPERFQGDPNLALQEAKAEDAQELARSNALQGQRTGEQNVQSRIEGELRKQHETLENNVPEDVYSDIENRAIDAVTSGRLTEKQAAKEYGKELQDISKNYKDIETLGTAKIITKSAAGNKQALRAIRNDFKQRNDLENFAETMIAKNSLSPSKAYYLAYPVSDYKELNNEISRLPDINPSPLTHAKGYPSREREPLSQEDKRLKTLAAALKISPKMGQEASPLAIAEELKSKGYDPQVWMDYVDQRRKKLNISERQARELQKGRDFQPTLNDLWMFYFSGLDKLVEQQ